MQKLQNVGIDNPLLGWIKSFLTQRSLVVKIQNSSSNPYPITSGVIQGSVLGPLLFLLYVNDISDEFKHGNSFIYSNIQNDLNRLDNWCKKWCMCLNTSKCGIMFIGNKTLPGPFQLNNTSLKVIDSIKDLGITYNDHLSISSHVNSVTSKAINLEYKTQ
uniref:Reverse transcriptase domain-containing protein n=1 Tax=Oryzias sinensis TaxID=183150 RepID=A0A8C8DU65_9TELE